MAELIGINVLIPRVFYAYTTKKPFRILSPKSYRLVITHPYNSIIIDAIQVTGSTEYTQINTTIMKNGEGTEFTVYKDSNGILYLKSMGTGGTIAAIIPLTLEGIIVEEVSNVDSLERVF